MLKADLKPRINTSPSANFTSHFFTLSNACNKMAPAKSSFSFFLFFFSFFSLSISGLDHINPKNGSFSLSFKLSSVRRSSDVSSSMYSSLFSNPSRRSSSPYNYRSRFKYSMALIVSLPIGTPPQAQQMVLDTGSQLSWIQCHNQKRRIKPKTTTFDPALSSSFSALPCTHPVCKPRIPDFTLPTTCDQNRLCHYSYFYADGTYAEGNLVREKFTFSPSQVTPPLILGCASRSDPGQAQGEGILGMNLGRLSFASQAKISKFSYCVPTRPVNSRPGPYPAGSLYLGENPNSRSFKYVDVLSFGQRQQRMPNFDPLAYTVGLAGIKIGRRRLNISGSVFRPDAGGSGQTFLDSGTEFTFLVDEAYNKVREELVRLVGPRMKKGYVYEGALDMCFDGRDAMMIGRLIGDMTLVFDKGVEVVVEKQRMLADVGGGVHCIGIGRSELLGVASNIIGNFHQQDLWVEYDVTNRRVGFGRADCSRS